MELALKDRGRDKKPILKKVGFVLKSINSVDVGD